MSNEKMKNLDRIVKVIMRPCPQLVVKHVVKLIRRSKDSNKTYDFAFEYGLPSFNASGVQFTTDDTILLESTKDMGNTKENGGVYKPPPQVFINYMDAPLVVIALDSALRWLQGEENKNVYIADVNGSPLKLGVPVKAIVPMNMNRFMVLLPVIIYDEDRTAYQGVRIKCETGDVADLTAQEFLSLALSLKYILMNFYMNSNILTLMGMTYVYNK